MTVAAIVNPSSAGGRTALAWQGLRPLLEEHVGPVQTFHTARRGHGTALAREALRKGFQTIIAVGGDGTVNEVVNGFFEPGSIGRSINPAATLAVLPSGTSSDLRRSLMIPEDGTGAAEVIRKGFYRSIDVGWAETWSDEGGPIQRYYANVASFGLGGAVADRTNRSHKRLGGRLTYVMSIMAELRHFRGCRVRLNLDGIPLPEKLILNVAVGNGQFHGAGMWICPAAKLDDGRLNVTVINAVHPIRVLTDIRALYNGKVAEHPAVEVYTAQEVMAEATGRARVEIDGEALGSLPFRARVIPAAIKVLTPA